MNPRTMPPNSVIRTRLLAGSTTRVFAALRAPATPSLARIRLVATAAVFKLVGYGELRVDLGILVGYLALSFLVQRWASASGWRSRLASFALIADVLLVFALEFEAMGVRKADELRAGWTLGLYALLVGFSGLALPGRIVAAPPACSFAALAVR